MTPSDQTQLETQLQRLHLHHIKSHYQAAATTAAEQQCSYVDYLAWLIEGETPLRDNRSIERRIRNARFPVLKTLEEFQWSWPKKINRPQIQNLFRLAKDEAAERDRLVKTRAQREQPAAAHR